VWQLPGVKSNGDAQSQLAALRERLRALLGAEDRFLAVDFTGDLTVVNEETDESSEDAVLTSPPANSRSKMRVVWDLWARRACPRSTREDQHVFVNRRPVENRGLNYALTEGYHTSLMKGRYPLCCLFVEIDPALVDVNIHRRSAR